MPPFHPSSSSSSRLSPPSMASIAPKEELNKLITSMLTKGVLDEQFKQLQMLQDSSDPGFVEEVLTLFFEDTEKIMEELTNLLNQTPVDFGKLGAYVHQMKGSSSSVGASSLKLACVQFSHFCEENSREKCAKALKLMKDEYDNLRSNLDQMLELEKTVKAYDANYDANQ